MNILIQNKFTLVLPFFFKSTHAKFRNLETANRNTQLGRGRSWKKKMKKNT